MALNQINLAPFMANPVREAINTGLAIPAEMQQMQMEDAKLQAQLAQNQVQPQLLQTQLARQKASLAQQEFQNQAAPQLLQAKLAESKQGLKSQAAKDAYLGAMISHLNHPATKILPTTEGYVAINPLTQTATQIMFKGQPLQPQTLNQGSFSIDNQTGQLKWVPSAAPAQGGAQVLATGSKGSGSLAMPSVPGLSTSGSSGLAKPVGGSSPNLVTTPTSPHSRFSTGGSTVKDTATNAAVSVPTAETAGRLQQILYGEQSAVPALVGAVHAMVPMLGGGDKMAQRAYNDLKQKTGGTPTDSYIQYAGAKEGLTGLADKLLKTFGMNATGENVNRMVKLISPNQMESPLVYQERVANLLAQMSISDKLAKNILANGILVTPTTAAEMTPDYNQRVHEFRSRLLTPEQLKAEGPKGMILLYSPQGEPGFVKPEKVNQFIKKGYKRG